MISDTKNNVCISIHALCKAQGHTLKGDFVQWKNKLHFFISFLQMEKYLKELNHTAPSQPGLSIKDISCAQRQSSFHSSVGTD